MGQGTKEAINCWDVSSFVGFDLEDASIRRKEAPRLCLFGRSLSHGRMHLPLEYDLDCCLRLHCLAK